MITFEPRLGIDINTACKEAIKLAIEHKDSISFDFNGVEMIATSESDVDTLTRHYTKSCEQSSI